MNGTEQRTHRTVTDLLGQRLDDLGLVLDGLASQLVETAMRGQETRRDVNALRVELRVAIGGLEARTRLLERGFLGRLRWLLTGR